MSEERIKERCKREDIALKVVKGFLEKDCYTDTELEYSLNTLLDLYNKQKEEIEELKEDNKSYKYILDMQNKREYRSKFLKDFQKENGKNMLPDYDEIYKRYDKQKEEIKELNSEFALNTEIHKRDEEIKELKETIKCLHEPVENYISKDEVLKAIGYEENDEEYDRLKQDDEKLLSILDTLYSEVCRLEDIEDKKVEVAVDFIEEKRDKYWQDKIREILKKYEKRPLEDGICFYKEIENLLEE